MKTRFDWNLIKPEYEVSEDQASLVREIAGTVLLTGVGIGDHQKRVELVKQGRDRRILDDLIQLSLIRNIANRFYPTFAGLYFVESHLRDSYASTLDLMLTAFRSLFEKRGYQRFAFQEIEHELSTLLFERTKSTKQPDVHPQRAAIFLQDFPDFVIIQEFNYPSSPATALTATDTLLDYQDLEQAWQYELAKKRPKPQPSGSSDTTVEEVETVSLKTAGRRDNWEIIGEPLGSGGQGDVFLVRGSQRKNRRMKDIDKIHSHNPWGVTMAETRAALTGELADAIVDYARTDSISELGAMKVFKLRETGVEGEQQALARLRQEIDVLQAGRPGLPKLLDFNLDERWMVTEYFPARSLEHNSAKYKGNVLLAFRAFLSLVKTVAGLHADNIIHRDIKPANVFVREDDQLVLGDFGIVYLPDQSSRVTLTGESVGPHDYMPPWAEVDGRLTEVHPAFDVYMLGKLLWCMVSGRLRLRREHFNRPEFDLTVLFAGDPAMHMVNAILGRCLVEEEKNSKTSANDLVSIVGTYVQMLERSGQLLHAGVPRPCRVCGRGHYRQDFPVTQPRIPTDIAVGIRLWVGSASTTFPVFPYVCDNCGHVEFFAHGAPRIGASGWID